MDDRCPRCQTRTPAPARFCARCGLALSGGPFGPPAAGRVRHPSPLAIPDDLEPVDGAVQLYFATESAWGGRRLLGTENIGLRLLNAGYAMRDVRLRVRGVDAAGREVLAIELAAPEWPRGPLTLEVPSYEIREAPAQLKVTLVSAEFAPVDESD